MVIIFFVKPKSKEYDLMNSENITEKLEELNIRTDTISDDKLKNDLLVLLSLLE